MPLRPNYHQPIIIMTAQPQSAPKSRVSYVILALLLGALGIHNFYAGYTGKGIAQLCITLLSLGFLGFVSAIWALVEAITVTQDATGSAFN